MDIEVRHLQALAAVAEVGTFARAAEALGFTQSAVSQQIAALEKAVGTPVFDRPGGPRPVRLTPAGAVLLEHAEQVLALLRMAQADVDAVTRGDRGRLRLGLMQSVGTKILPSLLTGFAADRPGVELVLHEAQDPRDLLAMVEAQELDLTFTETLDPDGPFVTQLVLEDPFVVLAPRTPEWTDREPISLEELATHPLVGNRNPSCFGQALLAFGDLEPTFVFQSDDNTTIQSCVAAGLGVSLAPMLTIDLDDPTITTVEVV
ncbi:MAG: LysR family transcriptional regulator, partial [Acidimicrobiales bacterium]|nr:LysR family transcriptional regulator [Acidimicrobiales bacterium]